MECPLQAKFRHLDNLPGQQHVKASFGTIVHYALENYHRNGDVEKAIAIFEDIWDNPEKLGVEPTVWPKWYAYGTLREKGRRIIEDYHLVRRWEDRETVGIEHRFLVPFGDHFLEGTMDLLEIRRDKKGVPTLYLVDLKTSGRKPTQANLALDVQWTVYTFATLQPEFWVGNGAGFPALGGMEAFQKFENMPRRGVWSHLWTGEEISTGTRNENDFKRLYRACMEIERAIKNNVYVPDISGDACNFCPYHEPCGVEIEKESDQIWLT